MIDGTAATTSSIWPSAQRASRRAPSTLSWNAGSGIGGMASKTAIASSARPPPASVVAAQPAGHRLPGVVEHPRLDGVEMGEHIVVAADDVGDDRLAERGQGPGEGMTLGLELDHPGQQPGQQPDVGPPPGHLAEQRDGPQLTVGVARLAAPPDGRLQWFGRLGRREHGSLDAGGEGGAGCVPHAPRVGRRASARAGGPGAGGRPMHAARRIPGMTSTRPASRARVMASS